MTRNWQDDALDAALRGEQSPSPELMGLMAVARQLDNVKQVPPLSEKQLSSAKGAFLTRAAALAPQTPLREVMPKGEGESWLARLKRAFQPPQGKMYAPALAALAVALVFLAVFGFSRLNLASQASLPGDPLYAYKIVREDLSAQLTFNSGRKVQVYLEQILERGEEISCYTQAGQALPLETVDRLEKQLNNALKAASQLPDEEMQASLTEIRQASETLGQTVAQAQPVIPDPAGDQTLEQAKTAVRNTTALADQGLRDPVGFRVNMAAPNPLSDFSTSTETPKVVYPPVESTPVVRIPSPTLGVLNPPLMQPTPSPTCTCRATEAVQETLAPSQTATKEAQPSPTRTDPPPVLPTATEIYLMPTQAIRTPTPTPTSTQPPGTGPGFPTPTPVTSGDG
jgi:hypothetical protein